MSAFAAQKPLSQRRLGGRKTSFSSSLVSSRDEPTVRILYSQLQKNKKLSLSGFIFYFWLGMQDSNLRMLEPESSALPLGESPIYSIISYFLKKC